MYYIAQIYKTRRYENMYINLKRPTIYTHLIFLNKQTYIMQLSTTDKIFPYCKQLTKVPCIKNIISSVILNTEVRISLTIHICDVFVHKYIQLTSLRLLAHSVCSNPTPPVFTLSNNYSYIQLLHSAHLYYLHPILPTFSHILAKL